MFSPGACVCGGWVWFGIDGVLHVHLSGSQEYVEYEFRDKPARAARDYRYYTASLPENCQS